MASKTRQCGECGTKGMRPFARETFTLDYAGRTAQVDDLSGWRCPQCGEEEFDARSAARYAVASDELVLRERAWAQAEIRRIRKKLHLSQEQAAELTGGGHNAFSRYERGEAKPVAAVVNLFRLLDNHPELLDELRKDAA